MPNWGGSSPRHDSFPTLACLVSARLSDTRWDRAACSDQGPLYRYKEAQDQEIRKLQGARQRRVDQKMRADEAVKAAESRVTAAANDVKELDQQISDDEQALKRVQGDEQLRLENELGELKTKAAEKRAERNHRYNQWKDAQKTQGDIGIDIKSIDAQLAKYQGRKTQADTSYKAQCTDCKKGFAKGVAGNCECYVVDDSTGECVCTRERWERAVREGNDTSVCRAGGQSR